MTGARTITFLDEVRTTLLPRRGAKYGLLPPQLVGMTVMAGLVDALSYLTLGHVFVANMTGNVVFIGFALAGVGGFSAGASLVALGAFLVGSLSGGMIGSRLDQRPSRLLSVGAAGQAVFLAGAADQAGPSQASL